MAAVGLTSTEADGLPNTNA